MKDLGCNYSSGNLQSYFCQIRSNKTRVLLNLTLMRVPGKQLSYDVVVRVASALGKPSDKIPKIETQFTVSEAPRNQSSNSIVVVRAIIVLVVVVCLVLVIAVLVYVLRRQKRKSKTQSRYWLNIYLILYLTSARLLHEELGQTHFSCTPVWIEELVRLLPIFISSF